VMPGLAGLSGMRYRRFLLFNAAGGLAWGLGCTVAGYLAGSSYQSMAGYLGQGGAAVAAVLAVVVLVGWRVAKHRRDRDESAARDLNEPVTGAGSTQ
jgi:membrane-associated protein